MLNFNSKNHFEKFSFSPEFDLDFDIIESRYLELQQKFHPDNLVNESVYDQNLAELNSIAANEAYEILKNPLKRAIYLLKLKGINIDDDNCQIKPDQETLTLILELKERLFANDDLNEALVIKDFALNEIKILMAEVKENFKSEEYRLAAKKLIKVKYLDKILLDIKLKNQNLL